MSTAINDVAATTREPGCTEGGEARVVVVGAGPAGLTCGLDLAQRGMRPLVLEADTIVGGLSKTIEHNGNRMDLGGHRFFSKSDRVMKWWTSILEVDDPAHRDDCMLIRSRLSRIYFLRRFFDYPVSLTWGTLRSLGFARTMRIGTSYLAARLSPRTEHSLEDFMINRFGTELYGLFFRDYTEKVWGVPCTEIGRDWGAQRIKGLSVGKTIMHAVTAPFRKGDSVEQEGVETSLISRFMYPKSGPGQLWETVAERVRDAGGEVLLGSEVVGVHVSSDRVATVTVRDVQTGATSDIEASAVFSTMPLVELVGGIRGQEVPAEVVSVCDNLSYRDFITCGILVDKLAVSEPDGSRIRDNWIYIQEPEVRLGRVQIFNNWSPYLVDDESMTWLGLEYFANEGDELWTMSDEDFAAMAAKELVSIGMLGDSRFTDYKVHRVRKAYPAYFGSYAQLPVVRGWLDTIQNLYVMGRNGMHRYNNMDHSMLSAWAAVAAFAGEGTRAAIWDVNAEETYHEQ